MIHNSTHTPVLLNEVIETLALQPGDFAIDGTAGGGGHARAMLKRITPGGTLLAVDWDAGMVARLTDTMRSRDVRLIFVHENYADVLGVLTKKKLPKADALILDLGFSSEQLEGSGRGFSFLSDEPLVMTYDDSQRPLSELLRKVRERDLVWILRRFGEERYATRVARAIYHRERREPIATAAELAATVRAAVPKGYERGKMDPAARTFQALRIWANGELENLEHALHALPAILKPGGRAAVISFHSLEDRIVKESFKNLVRRGLARLITKKPIVPSEGEIKRNPRSRSAKLRAVIML